MSPSNHASVRISHRAARSQQAGVSRVLSVPVASGTRRGAGAGRVHQQRLATITAAANVSAPRHVFSHLARSWPPRVSKLGYRRETGGARRKIEDGSRPGLRHDSAAHEYLSPPLSGNGTLLSSAGPASMLLRGARRRRRRRRRKVYPRTQRTRCGVNERVTDPRTLQNPPPPRARGAPLV